MTEGDTSHEAVAAVWRNESARLLGGLVRFVGDVDTAEDVAQEALMRALAHWPQHGIPQNPGAWLMTTAKRIAIDRARHRQMASAKVNDLINDLVNGVVSDAHDGIDDEAGDVDVKDDVLRLMLIACHPVLSRESRVALTLRWVAGLSTAEIARAFLTSEPTVAQRLVRAKRTLAEARVPYALPTGTARTERLPPVLDAIYLVFNEGYRASAGDDLLRPALCDEALRLARRVAALVGDDAEGAEVHGLVALLELQSARLDARVDVDGAAIALADQDRSRFDRARIERGRNALARAELLAQRAGETLGPYALQAAIAACHATASSIAATDWPRIVALYDALVEQTGSPVVELNRAVAVAMAYGAAEGLALVDALADEPALKSYPLTAAVRGDLLERLGRVDEAAAAFDDAAARTENARERAHLSKRARLCLAPPRPES